MKLSHVIRLISAALPLTSDLAFKMVPEGFLTNMIVRFSHNLTQCFANVALRLEHIGLASEEPSGTERVAFNSRVQSALIPIV